MFKNENKYYRVEICDPFLEKILNSKDFGKIETQADDAERVHIRFGSYPQTKITDKTLVAKLLVIGGVKEILSTPTAIKEKCHKIRNSYYLDIDYNGNKYRAVMTLNAKTFSASCFKFEPIDWTVYTNIRDNYSIMPDKVLDCVPFHENGYNVENVEYINSSVRKWLNNTFFGDAFDSSISRYIMMVTSNINDDKGNSTFYDKVDLLPIEEYESLPPIGNTDYALAMGVGIFPEMTRTTKGALVLGANSNSYAKTLAIGIRPVIRITPIAGTMFKI